MGELWAVALRPTVFGLRASVLGGAVFACLRRPSQGCIEDESAVDTWRLMGLSNYLDLGLNDPT